MTTPAATATTTSTAPAAGAKREQQQPPPQPSQAQRLYHSRQQNSVCGGEGCVARDPWPVHNVRHRGNLCRLCTSCVLRYHAGSFCLKCFELVDTASGRFSHQPLLPLHAVVYCTSCPSACHTACLADSDKAASYVCPSCANPNGYSYFPLDSDGDGGDGDVSGSPSKKVRLSDGCGGEENPQADGRRHRAIDRGSAKVLLTAARLASSSMNKAVISARNEAERKAKDAVIARKKAKEMLEKALVAAKREREKRQDVLAPMPAMVEPQRKAALKPGNAVSTVVAQKRKQSREREQWIKVEDVTPLAQKPSAREITENERVKAPFPGSNLNHGPALTSSVQDSVKLDIGKNGSLPASKSNFAAENKRGAPKVLVESGVGVQSSPTKQEASVTKTNPRVIFTNMPDKTSLHS